MAIKSKINYNNSNVLGTSIFSKEEISAPIDNIPVQSVISYLETTNITPRDYYKGTSFRYSGGWLTGTHYLNDQYFVDFVVINNVLLRCKKSHLSSLESKPVRFIYDDKGNIVGIDSEYWDFVLSGFNVIGSNFQRYYEGNTSDITNPGEGDICTVPNSNTSYIYYKGEWHPWLYISLDNITNWNNKADKVHSAVAGHIATLDSSGNLVDSGKGISDINPLWGNIQGSIANQTDLMEALNAKYEKPSTGIPASHLADGVIPDVSNFITASVNNLVNYYLKSETYTKAEVAALIGAIQQFHYEIYPSTNAVQDPQSNVLYLIGPTGSGSDRYEEYVFTIDWVKIGDTSIDLSNYITTSDLNTALSAYTTSADLETILEDYVTFNDLADRIEGVNDRIEEVVESTQSYNTAFPQTAKAGDIVRISSQAWAPSVSFAERELGDPSILSFEKNQIKKIRGNSLSGDQYIYAYINNIPEIIVEGLSPDEDEPGGELIDTSFNVTVSTNATAIGVYNEDSMYGVWTGTLEVLYAPGVYEYDGVGWIPYIDSLQKEKWTAKYDLPFAGIPYTDLAGNIPKTKLASAVQTSLGKADTAYQKPQYGIPESDLDYSVTDKLRDTVQFNSLPSSDITSVEDLEDYGFSRNKLISLAEGTASALIFNEPIEYGASLSDYRQTECTITKCTKIFGDVSDQCELSFILNGYEYAITADYNTGVATVTVTAVQDITNKADKVSGATNGHLAALDSNGNLTDSGKSTSDFQPTIDSSHKLAASLVSGLAAVATSGSYNDLSNIPPAVTVDQIYDGTSSNPQSGIAIEGELENFVEIDDYSDTFPIIVNPSNYYTKTETEAIVETPIESTQPSNGFLPNVIYDLGEITNNVTFTIAVPTNNNIANAYVWTFDTGSTAPTITWPLNIIWFGGSAPAINTGKHYEITVRKGYANCLEF